MNQTAKQWLIGLAFVAICGALLFVAVLPWFSGTSDVNTVYGRRSSRGRDSVNGTSVFAEMFSQAGHKVRTWRQLSPRLHRSQVIVWTPNSFELPSMEEIDYFNHEWLPGKDRDLEQRTLIYVARDYDAAIEYWRSSTEAATGEQFIEKRRRLAKAQSTHAYGRSLTGRATECEWFSIDSTQSFIKVTPSDGKWANAIDPEATDISVAGRLKSASNDRIESEVLLGSQETPLILRLTNDYDWGESQVIVVLNSSSILNLPLVNHENRKIAAQLIKVCGSPGRTTFLESDPSGLTISSSDPRNYSGFEALRVWPINSILMHLIVAGILFCAMVFPIFGRPRELQDDELSDFGKHIRAMGELFALTSDREAALMKVRNYRRLNLDSTRTQTEADSSDEVRQQSPGNPFGNPFKASIEPKV